MNNKTFIQLSLPYFKNAKTANPFQPPNLPKIPPFSKPLLSLFIP